MNDDERAILIAEILENFVARARDVDAPSAEEILRAHPDLADELRPLLFSVKALERAKAEKLDATGPAVPVLPIDIDVESVGDFRLVREIGRGGMGVVYEAVQSALSRRVAVKILPRAALGDAQRVERFRKEAETASRLNHQNIVPVYGVGKEGDLWYYAMMLIPGVGLDCIVRRAALLRPNCTELPEPDDAGSIADRALAWFLTGKSTEKTADLSTDRRGRFRRAAEIARSIADALDYAHSQGVLHRDVKPSNLLIEPSGKVWIMDFGIAKVLDQPALTAAGEILGTMQYSAPEQLDGAPNDKSDVYALGLTLYELIALERAFTAANRRELLRRVKDGAMKPLASVEPTVPSDLEVIIAKATAFDPAHRYGSAKEFADDLSRFLDDRPIAARKVSVVEKAWRWTRRNRTVASLGAATSVAVLAAVVVGWASFLSTDRALTGERAAREEAGRRLIESRDARARAEKNLDLSLEAFDDMFDAIAGRDDLFGGQVVGRSSPAPMSQKDIATLEKMLRFYGRFALTNAEDARLDEATARAHLRIGDIHRRRGSFADAEAAYRRSLGLFRSLDATGKDRDFSVEIALIFENLGMGNFANGKTIEGLTDLGRAREILEKSLETKPEPRTQFELARTLNAIGSISRASAAADRRSGSAAPGSSMREPPGPLHRRALEIAARLTTEFPGPAKYRLLLARSHRLLSEAEDTVARNQSSAEHMAIATSILEALAAEHPEVPDYVYELAETEMSNAQRIEDSAAAEKILRRAADRLADISVEFAGAPAFVESTSRVHRDLARRLFAERKFKEAAVEFAASFEAQRILCDRFPAMIAHKLEFAGIARDLAANLRESDRPREARDHLAPAARDLVTWIDQDPNAIILMPVAEELLESLVNLETALGETEAAAETRGILLRLKRFGPDFRASIVPDSRPQK